MRKALLVFALVAFLATGTVFAELTGVGEPTVSGSVSTTFGYDLDDEASGFVNDSSLTLTLPLLDGSMTKGGDDGMYGEITVDGIGWQLNNDGFYDVDEDADELNASDADLDASISAKLVINEFFVKLGEPGFDINNVDISDDYEYDAHVFADDALYNGGGGMSLGFMNDLVTVEAIIASYADAYQSTGKDGEADADADAVDHAGAFDNEVDEVEQDLYTTNEDNLYIFGAAVTLAPMEGVSIPVSFSMDSDQELMGVGAAPSITMAPVTFDLPVDYVSYDDQWGFEVNPAVTYCLTEAGGSNVALDFLYGTYEESVGPENAIADLGFTFTETETKGFVPNMAATLEVTLSDMMDYADSGDDMGWDVDGTASYNVDGLKPYVGAGYGSDEVLDMNVGVEMAAAFTGFDNTVFTLDYANDALTESVDDDDTESGRVTFDVTVSF